MVVNNGLLIPKFNEIHEMLTAAFARRGTVLERKSNTQLLNEIGGERPPYDFVLFYDKDVLLCQALEQRGLPVFNSSRAIALCDDKGLTALALEGLPMPRQILSPLLFFGSLPAEYVKQVAERLGFPMVVKAAKGSFGAQVTLMHSVEELTAKTQALGAQALVFQEYIETQGRDVRIYVADGQVVDAIERHAQAGEFRANLSLGGSMRPYVPTARECELALEACARLGVLFGGVDLIAGEHPLLLEVNSNAHFKNLYDCTGHDFAADIAACVLRRLG